MALFIVMMNKKLINLRIFFTQHTILVEHNTSLPQTINAPRNNLEAFRIASDEVEYTLPSLPTEKASGPDSMNNKILKDLAQPLPSPLKNLFHFSLEKGQIPIIWKQAYVTPIFIKIRPFGSVKLEANFSS